MFSDNRREKEINSIFKNSQALKLCALYALRFKYKYNIVATEFLQKDVAGINDKQKYTIEIEVKTSFADFKKDFNKKKHQYYNDEKIEKMPRYFYFLIAPFMFRKVDDYLKTVPNSNYYGIMLPISFYDYHIYRYADANIKSKCYDKWRHYLIDRLTSENYSLRNNLYGLRNQGNMFYEDGAGI